MPKIDKMGVWKVVVLCSKLGNKFQTPKSLKTTQFYIYKKHKN
jgi:hypothetical protein